MGLAPSLQVDFIAPHCKSRVCGAHNHYIYGCWKVNEFDTQFTACSINLNADVRSAQQGACPSQPFRRAWVPLPPMHIKSGTPLQSLELLQKQITGVKNLQLTYKHKVYFWSKSLGKTLAT